MKELLAELVEARRPWVSQIIRSWYAEAELTEQLGSAMTQEADRVGNAAFGQELREWSGLASTDDPLEWANRRLDLSGGGWAVTGIRFRAGDASRPFVDVIATTGSPTADDLAALAATVVPAYQAFAPLCLRVDAPDPAGLVEQLDGDPRFEVASAVDMHVVAGLVQDLREHPRAPAYSSVSLRAGDPQELAPRVTSTYAELAVRQPELAMWANPEDADSLAESAGEGLLFEVLVDDEPAGVVASIRDDAHAMTGFSVQELCLDAAHRGRNLAAGTVQRLIDELPAGPGDVLWGTIHPSNLPSLCNALSVGRVHVGGYAWVVPAGMPGMPARAQDEVGSSGE